MYRLTGKPKVFRDPIHGDISFPRDDFGRLVAQLMDTRVFQRLRGIRQNALMNLVFPGAEHSRFTHSLGVAHVAGWMFDVVVRNSAKPPMPSERQQTVLAALLHDIGHGPFSHSLEEIVDSVGGKKFDHEEMTRRIVGEAGSEVHDALAAADKTLPAAITRYYDKKRPAKERRWYYQLVSSQLDADRIDYLARDARMAGVRHRFDHARLIESLGEVEESVVVDRRAVDVAESFLLAIDQMYEAVYFHKTARAASVVLTQVLRRAWALAKDDAARLTTLFPLGDRDPLVQVLRHGHAVSLEVFAGLDEHHVWSLFGRWYSDEDLILRDLVRRIAHRRLFKPVTFEKLKPAKLLKVQEFAQAALRAKHPDLDPSYYVVFDDPERESYRRYTLHEGPYGAIQILTADGPRAIEELPRNIVAMIESTIYYMRFLVHEDVRADLLANFKEAR